jgi:hypothetical protein
MKRGLVLWFAVAVMCCAPVAFAAGQYVEVTEDYASVYEFLDPKSKILDQAKKGDRYELVYPGTSWYQIKVAQKVGWLERRSGKIVDGPRGLPVGSLVLLVIVLVVTLGGAFYFIQRQKTAEL